VTKYYGIGKIFIMVRRNTNANVQRMLHHAGGLKVFSYRIPPTIHYYKNPKCAGQKEKIRYE